MIQLSANRYEKENPPPAEADNCRHPTGGHGPGPGTPAPAEKTVPSEALPRDDMPVLRTDATPMPMPTPRMQGGMLDRKTGKYILYNDSRTGLGYNFEKQEITDYKTGKVYKFSEHPAYKGPKGEPKKRDYKLVSDK